MQFDYLDTNHDGNVDVSEFMEFCMAIPTLPWKAEKTRQLEKSESTDTIVDAARNIERRKSVGKTIPIGEKLYEGRKFFWRTQEVTVTAMMQYIHIRTPLHIDDVRTLISVFMKMRSMV